MNIYVCMVWPIRPIRQGKVFIKNKIETTQSECLVRGSSFPLSNNCIVARCRFVAHVAYFFE